MIVLVVGGVVLLPRGVGKEIYGNTQGGSEKRPDEDIAHRTGGFYFPLGQHQFGRGVRLFLLGTAVWLFGGLFCLRRGILERFLPLLLFLLQRFLGVFKILRSVGSGGRLGSLTALAAPNAVVPVLGMVIAGIAAALLHRGRSWLHGLIVAAKVPAAGFRRGGEHKGSRQKNRGDQNAKPFHSLPPL